MKWLPIPESHGARFAELAAVFSACRDALRDVAHETDWRAASGSLADQDHHDLSNHEPPYPTHAVRAIPEVLYSYLFGAGEQLGGLAALYKCREVLLTPGVFVRTGLEFCAHVVWVLGTPVQPVDDRLARAYLERYVSFEQAKMNLGRLLGKTDPQYSLERCRFEECRNEAQSIFPAPTADGDGRAMFRGQQMPGLEKCVTVMFESAEPPLSSARSEGIYGLMSNFSHPTLYAITRLWALVERDGEVVPKLQLGLEDHEQRARIAVVAFYTAFTRTMIYNGWTSPSHGRMTAEIDRLLPGTLVP
ncbi:hypothetical protein [Candidatus Solirubrobacter pratensis]|uniref:hypothetical protein n=1 Tax=Candidatus Solirubrobacter pratensis TaxID=1298857 RepID=UPI000413034C|nr:hypothetical protein [Candidatus Solirubrobacter pratensis]